MILKDGKSFYSFISGITLFILFLSFCLCDVSAARANLAEEKSQVQAEQRKNNKKLEELSAGLEGLDGELAQAAKTLIDLESVQIPAANQQLSDANEKLKKCQKLAIQLKQKLKIAKAKAKANVQTLNNAKDGYSNYKSTIASIVRQNLKGGASAQSLTVFFDSENTNDFISGLEAENLVSRNQSRLVDEYAELIATMSNSSIRQEAVTDLVGDLKKKADENEQQANAAKQAAEDAKSRLVAFEKQQKELTAQLQANKQKMLAQQQAAEDAKERIRLELAEIAQRELGGNGGGATGGVGGRGIFNYPSATTWVSSPFGWRCLDLTGCTLHTGTDFPAGCGTPIYASARGSVIHAQANWYEGGNMQVQINHGVINGSSWITTYNHMSAFAVGVGQYVSQGQLVGYVGSTGWSTGCHLHFEVLQNGQYIDPMSVL